jgi:hypothetical protein
VFRCHVEDTQQWNALEIPEWMFDAGCNRMLLVDKPLVTCEAVSNAASPQRHCTDYLARASRLPEMNITAISGTTRVNLN